MNHYLASAITSIIDAKGENIIDDRNGFLRIFSASTRGCEDTLHALDIALASGAVMIIAQAKNDDNIGQENATRIAIEILMSEGISKDMAIDIATAFGTAFGFSYGMEKRDDQLFEDAQAHLSKQEYPEAIKLLKYLMKKENNAAFLLMGDLYYAGVGTSKSYKKAMECYERSCTGDGYSKLAVMYAYGYGCNKSIDQAIDYWNKGAALGNAVCEYQLAMVYLNGISGVKKDYAKAVLLIKSSAQKGFNPALKALSALPKDHIEKTEKEILELEKAADIGDPKAIYALANCYFKGDGVPQSKSKAIDLYTKAAHLGHFASMIALITRYTMDNDIPRCWTVAKKWYDEAVKIDKARLTIVHPGLVKGEEIFTSVPKTAKNKRERYKEAGDNGYISAYTAIAKTYRSGEKALPWLMLAADAGDIEALELILKHNDVDKTKYKKIYDYVLKCSN